MAPPPGRPFSTRAGKCASPSSVEALGRKYRTQSHIAGQQKTTATAVRPAKIIIVSNEAKIHAPYNSNAQRKQSIECAAIPTSSIFANVDRSSSSSALLPSKNGLDPRGWVFGDSSKRPRLGKTPHPRFSFFGNQATLPLFLWTILPFDLPRSGGAFSLVLCLPVRQSTDCLAALLGCISNHVPQPGARFLAGFGRYSWAALRRSHFTRTQIRFVMSAD